MPHAQLMLAYGMHCGGGAAGGGRRGRFFFNWLGASQPDPTHTKRVQAPIHHHHTAPLTHDMHRPVGACRGGNLQSLITSCDGLLEEEARTVAYCALTFLARLHKDNIFYGDMKASISPLNSRRPL